MLTLRHVTLRYARMENRHNSSRFIEVCLYCCGQPATAASRHTGTVQVTTCIHWSTPNWPFSHTQSANEKHRRTTCIDRKINHTLWHAWDELLETRFVQTDCAATYRWSRLIWTFYSKTENNLERDFAVTPR